MNNELLGGMKFGCENEKLYKKIFMWKIFLTRGVSGKMQMHVYTQAYTQTRDKR